MLSLLSIKPLRKYTIACPKCSELREKGNTRSLTIYRDKDKFIRWQCSHAGQCPWNERQWAIDPSPEDLDGVPETSAAVPLKAIGELPKTHEGNPLWWYRNAKGEPLYAVMRQNTDTGKSYYPVSLKDGTTTVRIPAWPESKTFYGEEKLVDASVVLVVEGEKSADAAQLLFPKIAVITWRGGAANLGTADWSSLKEKKVYLWPDNDAPGIKAMHALVDKITNCDIYMVDTAIFPSKSDLADNLPQDLINKQIHSSELISKSSMYCTLEEIKDQAERLDRRFTTGWAEIDDKVSFPSSGVVVLEGRTGHAKTGSAVNLAHNVLGMGGLVHFFSYEIPASRVVTRFVRVNEEEEGQVDLINQYIEGKKLNIYDQSRQLPLSKLKMILDSPRMQGSLVVIDYAQIVPCEAKEMRFKMIELMDTLRILANTHGFLVLLLSQLTPDYANPLHDVPREAKDIHFSAEMVLRVWNKDNEFGHPLYDEVPGNYVMHVLKNRDGEAGHLIGFVWDRGAYLEPNGHITKGVKAKYHESRSTVALETIATILQNQYGSI